MTISSVLLKTPIVVALPGASPSSIFSKNQCLRWRQRTLWVKKAQASETVVLPALSHETWLRDCLERSMVKQICLDPHLGEEAILIWANIARQVNKDVLIRIPARSRLSKQQRSFSWLLKVFLSQVTAVGLLFLLSPLMILVTLLIKFSLGSPALKTQWCVGQRGKLFQKIRFRTLVVKEQEPQYAIWGEWLQKYHLDELPQLWNVAKGEMMLWGSCPRTVSDELRLNVLFQKSLNALTGGSESRCQEKIREIHSNATIT